ncbi:MAG TPA: VCBS repeat-containing protein, partial [Bryobacteraceae bacterium]|nr:VCBS repeat-containing protein [Bryobacteraceae bacterium]
TPKGWFEAPADPRTGDWRHHADWDEAGHLSFMHVLDLNGDGKNDVLTALSHDYGIFWLEQGAAGKWTRRVIDDSWSQPHALTLVDLTGDGHPELITGKRYMAHNGKDPGEREPLGVYWYESRKSANGQVEWVRHVADYGSRAGGGMQIAASDLDGDGDIDLVCPGKSGLFIFENRTK